MATRWRWTWWILARESTLDPRAGRNNRSRKHGTFWSFCRQDCCGCVEATEKKQIHLLRYNNMPINHTLSFFHATSILTEKHAFLTQELLDPLSRESLCTRKKWFEDTWVDWLESNKGNLQQRDFKTLDLIGLPWLIITRQIMRSQKNLLLVHRPSRVKARSGPGDENVLILCILDIISMFWVWVWGVLVGQGCLS